MTLSQIQVMKHSSFELNSVRMKYRLSLRPTWRSSTPYEWNDEWKEYGFRDRDTYAPDSYTKTDDGDVMVSWDVMCNLDAPRKYLEECFGDDNVEDIGWR